MAARFSSECEAYEPEDFEPEDSSWPQQEMHIEIFAQIESQLSFKLHREPLDQLTQPGTSWSLISGMLSAARVPLPAQPNMIHKISDSVRSIASLSHNKNRKTIPMIVMLMVKAEQFSAMSAEEALLEDITVSVQDQGECVICLEAMEVGSKASRMPCSHVYHGSCIRRWLKTNSRCPLCRFEMSGIPTATSKFQR